MPLDLKQALMLQMLALDLVLLLMLEQLLQWVLPLLQVVQHLEVRLRVKAEAAVMAHCSHALHALPACKQKITSGAASSTL